MTKALARSEPVQFWLRAASLDRSSRGSLASGNVVGLLSNSLKTHAKGTVTMTNSLVLATVALLLAGQSRPPANINGHHFSVLEASIPETQAAMSQGRVTSHEIVLQYLTRIATYEDSIHAAI